MTGRGCLLKFAGPDDQPVVFYVADRDVSDGPAFLVGQGTSVASRTEGLSAFRIGQQPICGYAVRTEDSSSGEEKAGDTVVYFMAEMYTGTESHYILNVPTSSADAMQAFFDDQDALESGVFADSDFLDEIEDTGLEYADDNERARKASTVWMGDNRSLMLVSQSKQVIQFDANTKSFETLELDEDVAEERGSMLMAVRATQVDIENLGCT